MNYIWKRTTEKITGSPAVKGTRCIGSLSAGLRANIDNRKYQPNTVGLDRLGRKF